MASANPLLQSGHCKQFGCAAISSSSFSSNRRMNDRKKAVTITSGSNPGRPSLLLVLCPRVPVATSFCSPCSSFSPVVPFSRSSAAVSPSSSSSSSSSFISICISLLLSASLLLCSPPKSTTAFADEIRHCKMADLQFQYTPCDQHGNRWLFAVPRSHQFLCTPDSIPAPSHGMNCSLICPAGHFLEMHFQQCKLCQPGSFSLGDRVRYEQFGGDQLPEEFTVENLPDESIGFGGGQPMIQCGSDGSGWRVEGGELRYRVAIGCVSTLSISLHLTRPGFAEFQYQMSKDSRALISMLQVRNAQCQAYGNSRNPLVTTRKQKAAKQLDQQQQQEGGTDRIRVQKLALQRGQNLITWSVAVNPVLSSRMEMIRLIRMDISGLAFSPDCSPCPVGTFTAQFGAQHCEPCAENEFAGKGATRCERCPPTMWAEPRSEFCRPRPPCTVADFFPVRPSVCIGSQKVYQRKIAPTICRDSDNNFFPQIQQEMCPPCAVGFYRNSANGKCEKCPNGEVFNGRICEPCPAGSIAENGIYLTRWDSLPPELDMKMECEFLSAADDLPSECHITPAWITTRGDRLESVQTRMRGIALELNFRLTGGFFWPLHSGKPTTENPLGEISLDLELQCRDACQFYLVQEFDLPPPPPISIDEPPAAAASNRQLQMLALLNGTQSRRLLTFPVVDALPRRLMLAFTRSGAMLAQDELTDRAIIYSLNITHTGSAGKPSGTAHRCVQCPRMDGGTCQPCPAGQYWAPSLRSCQQCPPGTVLNQTAIAALLANNPFFSHAANVSSSSFPNAPPPTPCVRCPPNFDRSADGFTCEFSGHFDLADEQNVNGDADDDGLIGGQNAATDNRMHFDLTALRDNQFNARGIRVFARDGQSYSHMFNFSLFPDRPVRCQDSLPTTISSSLTGQKNTGEEATKTDEESGGEDAMFCRYAAIPLLNDEKAMTTTTTTRINNGTNAEAEAGAAGGAGELFVSSTIISRKLALVTRHRQFGTFHLSDDQLEYESNATTSVAALLQRSLDIHFFYEPLPSLSALSNCPNGTLSAVTIRCEPTVVAKPQVHLSRRCPDGTCDGCVFHAIVESAHGCPVCTAHDFQEIRGECVNGQQRVHSIPAKHCVLSGAQSRERMEACHAVLTPNVRLILAIAIGMILFLLLIIFVIYRRNRTLEYRYSRLVEGGRSGMRNSVHTCGIDEAGSDLDGTEEEEDEEEGEQEQQQMDSSRARVFFSVKKKGMNNSSSSNNNKKRKQNGTTATAKRYSGGGRAEERTEFIAEQQESD